MLRTMRLPLRVEDNLSLRATRHRRNPAKIDAVPRRRCVVRLLASGGGSMSTRLWWIGPMVAAALGTALWPAAAGVHVHAPTALKPTPPAHGVWHTSIHTCGARSPPPHCPPRATR